MNHPITSIQSNIDKPYYFGIGGIGDFLLLMATFYDKVEPGECDVIFVANNPAPIKALIGGTCESVGWEPLFDKINRVWIFPRKAFPINPSVWNAITFDPRCMGTGVTPKQFAYIEDWNKCGKENCFSYYGVNKHPKWARSFAGVAFSNRTVIQPFGGADDKTKIKRISDKELIRIVNTECIPEKTTIIGSTKEMDHVDKLNLPGVELTANINLSVDRIRFANTFIGTDSWGKTMAMLAGVNIVIVYKNHYLNGTPMQLFNQPTDPADHVFLNNWGFQFRREDTI